MNPIFYAVFKAMRGREAGPRSPQGPGRAGGEDDVGRALRWLAVVGLVLLALLIAYFVFGR